MCYRWRINLIVAQLATPGVSVVCMQPDQSTDNNTVPPGARSSQFRPRTPIRSALMPHYTNIARSRLQTDAAGVARRSGVRSVDLFGRPQRQLNSSDVCLRDLSIRTCPYRLGVSFDAKRSVICSLARSSAAVFYPLRLRGGVIACVFGNSVISITRPRFMASS